MTKRAARFTLERRESYVELLKSGQTQTSACEELNISTDTIGRWLRRGRKETSGEYFDFAQSHDAIRPPRRKRRPSELVSAERAGGLDVPTLVALLEAEALNGNVQAIKYLLERPWERKRDDEDQQVKTEDVFDDLQALRERKARA